MSITMPPQIRGIGPERPDEQPIVLPAQTTILPPSIESPEAVRRSMLNHLTLAEESSAQSQQAVLHTQTAAAYLRRLDSLSAGSPEALSARAAFHAFAAGCSDTRAGQDSSWQIANKALGELRSHFPQNPLIAETLNYIAYQSFQQADRGSNGTRT